MARKRQRSQQDSGKERSRRQFVGGAAGAAAVGMAGLAGCSGFLGGGGGGPKDAIRDYVSAANDADAETANGLLHPDGNVAELSQQELAVFEAADLSIDSMEVLEETEERADVEVTLTISGGGMDETSTGQWDVRTHDGEWRIYAAGMN